MIKAIGITAIHKTKQISSVLLAGAMILAQTACGQQTNQPGASSQPAVSAVSAPATNEALEDGVARTTTGLVRGTKTDGVYQYLGIPYAKATERFVPAGEPDPWEGVRDADQYGPMSPQGAISGVGGASDQNDTDNSCQNLNIWTPGPGDGAKRPVMVWLHGGGFSLGTANEEATRGDILSRTGNAVVVSVNHRLNVFGHLDLSAYGEKYRDSANIGIADLVAALRWIRENIEAFGGDPENITLFGQSGGGAKVLALMTTPEAKGLFHKGIVQSGATETMGVVFNTKESSARLTENLLDILGISPENVEDLQTIPVDKLEEAAAQALAEAGEELKIPASLGGGYSMDWEPVVDGSFLPTDPVTETSFAEAGQNIPLLIGSNLNEWSGFFQSDPIPVTEELTAALQSAYPEKEGLTAQEVDSSTIRLPLLKIMSHKAAQNGAPVYAYIFTYGDSYHGAEISYVFGRGENETLSAQISGAWLNFAKTGVPSAEGLPEWEPYTQEGGATMILDTQSRIAYHHDASLMALLVPGYNYTAAGDSGIITKKEDLTFPIGMELGPAFTGSAYLAAMIQNDETYNFPATNNIVFAPGSRSAWHTHGGMVILGTGGVGYYQEEGKPAQIIRKGDVVQCPEGVRHWHGAAPDSWFSQVVIFNSHYTAPDDAAPEAPVTDEEYNNLITEEVESSTQGNALMFHQGEQPFTSPTFSGTAYLSSILEEENTANAPGLHYVVFEPGVINNWHIHEGGQILIATDGIGYHQIEGQPVEVLHPGDVALCPPGVKHWHGGSADTTFAHIAINTNPERTGLDWFDRISDEEYAKLPKG